MHAFGAEIPNKILNGGCRDIGSSFMDYGIRILLHISISLDFGLLFLNINRLRGFHVVW